MILLYSKKKHLSISISAQHYCSVASFNIVARSTIEQPRTEYRIGKVVFITGIFYVARDVF